MGSIWEYSDNRVEFDTTLLFAMMELYEESLQRPIATIVIILILFASHYKYLPLGDGLTVMLPYDKNDANASPPEV